MNKRVRHLIVSFLAVTTLWGGPLVASAAAAPSDDTVGALVTRVFTATDPKAAYEALPAPDRRTFDDHILLDAVRVRAGHATPLDDAAKAEFAHGARPTLSSPTADGCWMGEVVGHGYNTLGDAIFEFWVSGKWCVQGGNVTRQTWLDASGRTILAFWRYDGVKGKGSGIVNNSARFWAQHRFVLGSGGWDIQTVDQCIRAIGYSSATISRDFGCSIF